MHEILPLTVLSPPPQPPFLSVSSLPPATTDRPVPPVPLQLPQPRTRGTGGADDRRPWIGHLRRGGTELRGRDSRQWAGFGLLLVRTVLPGLATVADGCHEAVDVWRERPVLLASRPCPSHGRADDSFPASI